MEGPLPHQRAGTEASGNDWDHLFFGTWTGAAHTPSARANMCDHLGVMLTCPGSNSVVGGFSTWEEVERYRDVFAEDWKICNRSPEGVEQEPSGATGIRSP